MSSASDTFLSGGFVVGVPILTHTFQAVDHMWLLLRLLTSEAVVDETTSDLQQPTKNNSIQLIENNFQNPLSLHLNDAKNQYIHIFTLSLYY